MKIIIALLGKAGAGKDYLVKQLEQLHPEYHKIIHCTTRPARENEIDGREYYFLSPEEFIQSIVNGDMLEVTEFRDWMYGTTNSSLIDGVNFGAFNPESFYNLCESVDAGTKIIGIYLQCSDKERLLRQLNRENNPDVKEIVRRFGADENDFIDVEGDVTLLRQPNESMTDLQHTIAYIENLLGKVV